MLDSIPQDDIPQKYCPKCQQWKDATSENFHRDKTCNDGLKHACKDCSQLEYQRKHPNARSRKRVSQHDVPEGYKRCTKCLAVLPATLEYFHHDKKYGLKWVCKPCGCKATLSSNRQKRPLGPPIPPGFRVCTGCNGMKPATLEFFRTSSHPGSGLDAKCKECRSDRQKRYYHEHPEQQIKNIIRTQRYVEQHKEQVIAYQKRRRILKQDDLRVYYRNYRIAHQEHYRERMRAYRQTEVGQAVKNASEQRRRARKRSIQGTHTAAQIQEQLKRQHYRCYYAKCGFAKFKRVKGKHLYEIEHTYPLSRVAGTDIPANDMSYLVLSCEHCNGSKGNKYPWEFFEGGRLL